MQFGHGKLACFFEEQSPSETCARISQYQRAGMNNSGAETPRL
jgi:hypothetical protein